MNNLSQKRTASLTIEISLLMPAVLSVIFLLLYICFYYHDRCVIERYTYAKARFRADQINRLYREKNVGNIEDIDNHLIGKWSLLETEEISEGSIMISVSGKMSSLNGLFTGFISDKVFDIQISEYTTLDIGIEYLKNKK